MGAEVYDEVRGHRCFDWLVGLISSETIIRVLDVKTYRDVS